MPTSQLRGTLANYIERTRRYLREETASKSHWSDDFLKQLFNSAYRLRSSQLVMAFEGYFTIVAVRDITADQERYAWPSGFDRLLKMELVRDDGKTVPIERFERHKTAKQTPSTGGDDYFPTYRSIGSGFVLEPGPNASVTNGLRIEYHGTPEELTDDDDNLHSDFPPTYDELLVLDTAVMAFAQESMQETGQMSGLLIIRAEWDENFGRFIQNKMISEPSIDPFVVYSDA